MTKKSFKKPNYKAAVIKNVEKQNSEGRSYGYLNLPKEVGLFKESKGRIVLDILPYEITNKAHADLDPEVGIEVGTLWYRSPFKVHRDIGAGDGETVVCPTTFGLPCPICEYRKKRMAEGADKEEIKALSTSKRSLYVVVPQSGENAGKICIWNTPDYFVQELINKELEENEEFATFPDLEEGYSLKFRFDEETFAGTKYYRPSRLDFEEREPIDEVILKDVPKLDECLKVLSYKELTSLLFQIGSDEIEDGDVENEEEEEKLPRKKKIITMPQEIEEEEEEEEEDEEDEEYEEEEEEEDEAPFVPAGHVVCEVCGGIGSNSKGRKCSNCDGKGYVKEKVKEEPKQSIPVEKKNTPQAERFLRDAMKRGVDVSDLLDEEEEKPVVSKSKTSNKCPFGHAFGKDNDLYPKDCNKCDVWDACFDAS